MENILDIVYEYSKNRRILDFDALKIIYKQIIDLRKVSDIGLLREGFSIPIGKHYTQADLNIYNREITLYTNAIKRDFLEKQKYSVEENEISKYFNRNLRILFLMIHEIEHVNQLNHRFDNDLERELCVAEFQIASCINSLTGHKALKAYNNYYKHYDSSILERLANIKSREFINKLIENLDLNGVKELQQILLLDVMMSSYIDGQDEPTIRFFNNLGYHIEIDTPLDYETRFRYGLRLTGEEYSRNQELLKAKRR